MKKTKLLVLAAVLVMAALLLSSCGNMTLLDTTYRFDRAQILMPDGSVVEGRVETWKDFGGDQLQVRVNGVTYLTHSANVVMMSGGN